MSRSLAGRGPRFETRARGKPPSMVEPPSPLRSLVCSSVYLGGGGEEGERNRVRAIGCTQIRFGVVRDKRQPRRRWRAQRRQLHWRVWRPARVQTDCKQRGARSERWRRNELPCTILNEPPLLGRPRERAHRSRRAQPGKAENLGVMVAY